MFIFLRVFKAHSFEPDYISLSVLNPVTGRQVESRSESLKHLPNVSKDQTVCEIPASL